MTIRPHGKLGGVSDIPWTSGLPMIVRDECGVDLRVNAWSGRGLQTRDSMITKADGRWRKEGLYH